MGRIKKFKAELIIFSIKREGGKQKKEREKNNNNEKQKEKKMGNQFRP